MELTGQDCVERDKSIHVRANGICLFYSGGIGLQEKNKRQDALFNTQYFMINAKIKVIPDLFMPKPNIVANNINRGLPHDDSSQFIALMAKNTFSVDRLDL